ncbi:glycosyltransferase family 9 protein [Flagellimonas sp. 389]|nr:glycosyltransferase family 9 protein [Flagellimonas sp. 389]MBS9461253.1 glycosyltransferase family 9 protein [Flagellimonas sp. 389]
MGDVAMTVPVLGALVAKYPHIKLTVLTKNHFAPLFSGLNNVEVYKADIKKRHKGLIGLWRLYRELKTLQIDYVADLHNVLRSQILKKYFTLDRTPFIQLNKGRAEKKGLIRAKNKVFKQAKTTHQRYADVFKELGFPIDFSEIKSLSREPLSRKVLDIVKQDTKKWIGIAPFAAHEGKMYPFHLMKEVIGILDNTEKYKILLFGGGISEVEKLNAIEKEFKEAINMAGRLDFSEELALISNLDLMLSMDSGNAHLAANYGIPVVTLWGVTHPFTGFYPFDQPIENALLSDRKHFPLIPTSVYGNKFPKGYGAVMETIMPEDVVEKIRQVLDA